MEYILSEKKKICVLCWAHQNPDHPESLVVYQGQRAFVMLNRFPYTSGHLMVVPNDHLDSIDLLDGDTLGEMMTLTALAVRVIRMEYHPQGFNIGINEGAAAGAGIADHIHLHIVPRWNGDTNFMSAVADVRVVPEALEDTLRRVTARWNQIA